MWVWFRGSFQWLQPRCSSEGPHCLNSDGAQGGDAVTLHPTFWVHAHSLHAREGSVWALPAWLCCLPLDENTGTWEEKDVWCSSSLSLI